MDAATMIGADRQSAHRVALARLAAHFVALVPGASIGYTPRFVLA
jgi:hypothetical protein